MHHLRQFSGDFVNNQREEFVDQMPRLSRANLGRIFTAPGTSRANKQQHNNMAVAGGAMPLYSGYSNFLQGMQPMMNQTYSNLYNLGTQNNTNAMVDAMRRQSMMSGLMANRTAMNMYGNSSLAQGMGINAMNKGIDASNAYMGQQYDPHTLMNRMSQGLGYLQQPLQNMQTLGNLVYGQPPVPVGKSGLDYVMQAAGLYAGTQAKGTTNNYVTKS